MVALHLHLLLSLYPHGCFAAGVRPGWRPVLSIPLRLCVATREPFFRSYFLRLMSNASHCSCHCSTRASAGLHSRGLGGDVKLLRESRRLLTGYTLPILCYAFVDKSAGGFVCLALSRWVYEIPLVDYTVEIVCLYYFAREFSVIVLEEPTEQHWD